MDITLNALSTGRSELSQKACSCVFLRMVVLLQVNLSDIKRSNGRLQLYISCIIDEDLSFKGWEFAVCAPSQPTYSLMTHIIYCTSHKIPLPVSPTFVDVGQM